MAVETTSMVTHGFTDLCVSTMATLLIAEAKYVKLWSMLILQLEVLHSLPGGVADIATLRKCHADL